MSRLNQDQIARLGAALLQRRGALIESVTDDRAHPDERSVAAIAGGVTDAGDGAVADAIADLGAARMDRHEIELRAIDAALTRLREGNFGQCSDCGAEIGYARLEASPAATRCIECQDKREHTFAHPETPRL